MISVIIRRSRIALRAYQTALVIMAGLVFSCSKTKTDAIRRDPDDENILKSSARVVLAGGMDVKVNDTKISNWLTSLPVGGPEYLPNATVYFPTTGKPGNTFFVPQQFIGANNRAHVALYSAGGTVPLVTTDVEDRYSQPQDYYYNLQYYPPVATVTAVPRPVVKPVNAANILVRLVNLSSDAVAGSGSDEALSLAYADGSSVSAATSHIAKGKWSEYTEIPYGTYEFRVMIDGTDQQYPAVPPQLVVIEGGANNTVAGTRRYFTQKRLFQPGGVYTIAVTYNESKFQDQQTTVLARINAFNVITDLNPAVNLSYARIQVANAAATDGLQVRIDSNNQPAVSFGEAGDYLVVTAGTHTIHVQDRAGALVRDEQLTVKGGDNLTIWVHPGTDLKGAVTILQNNMSGIINLAGHADGSDGSTSVLDPLTQSIMPIQTRFLNLCPELPYVSFTGKNGATLVAGTGSYPAATANIPFGAPPDPLTVPYPYINLGQPWMEAYQSQPNSVPGNRLYEVAPLTATDFIRMPASLYPNGLPNGEPGVYTVALIGRNTATQKPRLVVIKHNK